MTLDQFKTLLSRKRWWVALVVVVMMGYTLGKDMALRDNSRDEAVKGAN